MTTDPDAAESSILIVTVTGDPDVVTTELERVMRQIMGPLKPEERVTICMDLINFTGEMCLTDDP